MTTQPALDQREMATTDRRRHVNHHSQVALSVRADIKLVLWVAAAACIAFCWSREPPVNEQSVHPFSSLMNYHNYHLYSHV